MISQNEQIDLRTRLEVECDRKGISRAALARMIGKTPQALNDMISRGNMKATVLHQIATVLEVPMEILITPVSDVEYAEAKAMKRQHKQKKVSEPGKGGFFG